MLHIRTHTIGKLIFAVALTLTLAGCAGRPVQEGAPPQPAPDAMLQGQRPAFKPNSPVPIAEVRKAQRVLERRLTAYAEGDVETVLKTVPLKDAAGYRTAGEQMARHKGFRIKSITARPSTDRIVQSCWPDYVNLRVGYKAIVVFSVEGEYPNSTPDDVLNENFDAIMARTPGGRWLYIDSMCN